MALPAEREVQGLIPVSSVGFFSSGELFHDLHELGIFLLHCPLSTFSPELCKPQVRLSWSHRLWSEKFHASVAVPAAPVRIPNQRLLVPNVLSVTSIVNDRAIMK